jgi:hypothetical protein
VTLGQLIEVSGVSPRALAGRCYRTEEPGAVYVRLDSIFPMPKINGHLTLHQFYKFSELLATLGNQQPLPPVRLVARRNGYFGIVDGTHRVALSRALRAKAIPAVVVGP